VYSVNGLPIKFREAWAVIREAFGTHHVPSTLQGVTVLGCPDQLVEIEAVAAVIH
jgi:enamine deaminase RidA (YjgF/YER057c/UK114 family)